jgi:hypothetical protein
MKGISWEEAWGLSFLDRDKIIRRLNKHNSDKTPSKKEYM